MRLFPFFSTGIVAIAFLGQIDAQESPAPSPPTTSLTMNESTESLAPIPPMSVMRMYRGVPLVQSHPTLPFFADEAGNQYIFQDDLFAHPVDSNDIQVHPFVNKSSLGPASQVSVPFLGAAAQSASSGDDVFLRLSLQARPGVFYDTGFAAGKVAFNPANIAVSGTADAHNRGQVTYSNLSDGIQKLPIRGQLDAQSLGLFDLGHGQAYVDFYTLNTGDVFVRNAIARVHTESHWDFAIGKTETVFGDIGSVAPTTGTFTLPVGTVAAQNDGGASTLSVPQLRFTKWWEDQWSAAISIEDPNGTSGITSAASRTILNRWPTFVARLRYQGENDWDTYQVAGLFRRIGYENNVLSNEHFDSSWGVSASARFKLNEQRDAFFMGGVCGDGIGNYIYGSPTSVRIPTTNDGISTLRNYGAYAAVNHIWTAPEAARTLSSNFGYGYLTGQTTGQAASADTENRRLHQAWANLLLDATANSAYGLEYQYGDRLVGSGKHGEDHRIMFVVQIGTKTNASGGNQAAPASATSHALSKAERSPSVNTSPSFAPTSNTRLKYRL